MKIFAKTDKGMVRSINQDCFDFEVVDTNFSWALVCDGMGGTNSGEIASNLARLCVKNEMNKNYKNGLTECEIKNLMLESISKSNRDILEKSLENKEYEGMGTTIDLAVVIGDKLHVAHVGDSRVYLISKDKIEQITTDHSMVQEMLDSGEITSEQAKVHPKKNIITRALGVHEQLDADYVSKKLEKGDVVFMCTDGLSNYIDMENILKYINKYKEQELVEKFILNVNELGGNDNTTALVMYC